MPRSLDTTTSDVGTKAKTKMNAALKGGGLMDYVICDSVVIPPYESMRAYTESLLVLPHSYQPQDELQNDIAYELGLFNLVDGKKKETRLSLARSNRLKTRQKPSTQDEQGEERDNEKEKRDVSFEHIRRDRAVRYGFPSNAVVLACLNRNNKVRTLYY